MALSTGAVGYTNCIYAEGLDSLNERPGYDTKQSDDEASVMQELWEMWNTSSLPGPLRPRVVVTDRFLSMDQIELNCVLMFKWIVWNRTVFDIETVYLS